MLITAGFQGIDGENIIRTILAGLVIALITAIYAYIATRKKETSCNGKGGCSFCTCEKAETGETDISEMEKNWQQPEHMK